MYYLPKGFKAFTMIRVEEIQLLSGVNPINFFGINYIKTDVIHAKIYLVESIFDVIYTKICFIALTPVFVN